MSIFQNAIASELEAVNAAGRSKGPETIIDGVLPGRDKQGVRLLIQDREVLNMASNSYLGLSLHPELIKAAHDGASRYGVGPGAVRFISGTQHPHVELEANLARFHQKDKAMLFNSAYAANLGLLSSILDESSTALSDELNHNSIINALRLTKASKKVFKHLDSEDLRKQIQELVGQVERIVIITDGVFSMRGEIADLAKIAEIANHYDMQFPRGVGLVVDDSHGVGVLGDHGRGTVEHCGNVEVDLIVGTLGKAFGVNGGYVAGGQGVINYLREVAPLYIYSNSIGAGEAQALITAMKIIESDEGCKLLSRLRDNARHFRLGMEMLGYAILPGEHPIIPVMIGDAAKAKEMTRKLFELGVLVKEITFPIVPRGQDCIRVQVSAAHTVADIDEAVDAFSKLI